MASVGTGAVSVAPDRVALRALAGRMVARGIPEGGTVGAAASAVCDRVWCRAHARTACADLCPDGGLGHLCDHDSGGLTVLRRLPGRRADRPPGPRQLQGSGRA